MLSYNVTSLSLFLSLRVNASEMTTWTWRRRHEITLLRICLLCTTNWFTISLASYDDVADDECISVYIRRNEELTQEL